MKLRIKLYLLTACAVVVVLLVSGVLVWRTQVINRATHENQLAQETVRNLFELGILTTDYLLHGGERARMQWERKQATLQELMVEEAFSDPEDRVLVQRIRKHCREVGEIFQGLVAASQAIAAADNEAAVALKQRYVGQLDSRTQAIVSEAGVLAQHSAAHVAKVRQATVVAVVIGVSILAGFMLLSSLLFDRSVVLPIHRLRVGTEIVGSGNLDYKVGTPAQDEVGQLSRSFDEMTERLKALTVSRDDLAREVVERQRAEERARLARQNAEAANQAKSQFLTNMSHELRTPLNSVIGFANIMAKNKAGHLNPQEISYLDRIVANGKHLLFLINQILDLSKIEAHKVQLDWHTVDLPALIRETISQLEPQAQAKHLRLETQLPATMTPLVTDDAKLKQVLINLIGNALKFTARGGVTVRVDREEGTGRPCRIAVTDTGVGIAAERLGAIFEAFEQAESGTTRKYGGTGLGLTISRALCDLLGYRLEVASELGQGSMFSIEIPAAAAALAPATAPASGGGLAELNVPTSAGQPVTWKNKLVLVIDDEADARALLTHYVESLGCQVIAANSGEQGLRMAREFHPDAITLDLLMPTMDGWTVLQALKGDPQTQAVPVIIVSIVAREHRGSVLGAVDVLNKPVDRDELLAVLKKNLQPAARHVLIVDDNADDRQLLAEHLADTGYEVRLAGSGAEALRQIEESPPDVVVSDLLMPGMDGATLLHHLRSDARYRYLPAIIVTGKDVSPEEMRLLRLQAQAVVPKAGDLENNLRAVLQRLLQTP